jgi:hypothetical protein
MCSVIRVLKGVIAAGLLATFVAFVIPEPELQGAVCPGDPGTPSVSECEQTYHESYEALQAHRNTVRGVLAGTAVAAAVVAGAPVGELRRWRLTAFSVAVVALLVLGWHVVRIALTD